MPLPLEDAAEPTIATVNLAALRHNLAVLRAGAGNADLMAVVKADAYGHGAVRVASLLHEAGVRSFAVARVGEARVLREAGLTAPILVLGAPLPGTLPAYQALDLGVTVSSTAVAEAVLVAGATEASPLRLHVKVETGMHRLGLKPEAAEAAVRRLDEAPHLRVEALWTHLATADEPDQHDYVRTQLGRFGRLLRCLPARLAARAHVANSAAVLDPPVRALVNTALPQHPALARVGMALYGAGPTEAIAEAAGLQPALRLTARVTHLQPLAPGETVSYGRHWQAHRHTRVATLGTGYADGYPHVLGNRAQVTLHGRRLPVVGAVCMDMTMVELGPPGPPADAVCVGDEAVLFGPGGPSVFEVAQWAGTIPYAICTGVGARVPRRYVDRAHG